MTLAVAWCFIRGHNFSRWGRVPGTFNRQRTCRRCAKIEVAPARVKVVQTGGEGGV